MLLRRLLVIPLLLVCASGFCQSKSLPAVKTSQAPKIDGEPDDAVWNLAPVATDFIQNFPTFGAQASVKTEVRLLYDNNALYILAHLYDTPSLIRKQITARDGEQQSDVDYFSVFVDTYNDNQNGFQFLVTSMNVQTDVRLAPNLGGGFGSFGDKTWDAIWDSKVKMVNDGWIVEMKIPYISLRFSKKPVQDWGIQFLRFTRRNNESSYWNPVDPNVNGFVNQFGDLKGLQDIQPPLRLSFSPYISTGFRSTPQKNGYLKEWLRSGGMDVKYGINESFTLDATLIPDFGQVVSDNVINNLTPFEIRFQENRPFFTEGIELFNKAGLFYSRRIGATPRGYYAVRSMADADPNIQIIKNPTLTQLYNAIKFSGRTKRKLGIGFFNAVTAPMKAVLKDKTSGEKTTIETEPLTNYNIVVLDQSLKGQSYLTFTNTSVIRNGSSRDANVTAVDVALYGKNNRYAITGTARYSKIWNTNSYDGYSSQLQFSKVGGKLLFFVKSLVESKRYDPNDLGLLHAPNEVTYRANISYRKNKPTKNFINYSYSLDNRLQYLYKPYAYHRYDITGTAFWVFKNFWDVTLVSQLTPFDVHDYFFYTRYPTGKYLTLPLNFVFDASGSTDSRKKLFGEYGGTFARSPRFNNDYYGGLLGVRYRFSNKLSLQISYVAHKELNNLGYAFELESNGDPIVGFRDLKENITTVSGIYNFTSRMNLNLRIRHYWSEVQYSGFYNVSGKGDIVSRSFIDNKDENINIFNIDAFYTWDFKPGSKLIIGYKNWLDDQEFVPFQFPKNNYLKNLGEVLNLRHGNELTLRFIYFLDYNQLRKK